ncbi:hypothetical protein ACGFK1_31555 [Mycobacterium sp. NPDC048908]|uniref:hypothetical protein n=1 Tax=Mycobacterium sp. NPDC048908 TaxID=3364292 RepID=UPI0037113FB4
MILAVTLAKSGEDPYVRYRADRGVAGTPFYSLRPENRRVPVAAAGESFVTDIHRNRCGDAGELLITGVTVTVDDVVHDHRLDSAGTSRSGSLNYLCFGEGGEFYGVHQIMPASSFDQIVSITILDEALAQQPMRRAAVMTVPAADDVFSRLQPHDAPKAGFVIHPGTRGERTARSRITVGAEIYFAHRFSVE